MSQIPRTSRVSPVEKFLGSEALVFGPIGLLGLSPETCTDDRIVTSLEWQLDRVSQHAEGDTPEADEVRLALHAAAAQLLDKNVRRHVLARLGVAMPVTGATPLDAEFPDGEPALPNRSAANPASALEQDAILTLAMYGGWNKRSLQRLGALAHARGLSSASMAQSLANLATKKRRPASSAPVGGVPGRAAVPIGGSRLFADDDEPSHLARHEADGKRYLVGILLGATAGFFVLAGLAVYLVVLLFEPTPSGNTKSTSGVATSTPNAPAGNPVTPAGSPAGTTAKVAGSGSGAVTTGSTAPSSTPPTPAASKNKPTLKDEGYVDPLLVVRTLRDSASRVRAEPDATLPKFKAALDSLMSRWCRFDPQQRRAGDAAVIDFLYAASSNPAVAGAAIEPIVTAARALPNRDTTSTSATPGDSSDGKKLNSVGAAEASIEPGQVWPTVWAVGFLTRLSRERELPSDLASAVDAALTAAIGADRPRIEADFENGAAPAIRRVPVPLLRSYGTQQTSDSDGAPLAPWIEAVTAVAGADQILRERLLTDGLERVLLDAPDPREDKHVFAAIAELAVEIKWRKGGPARSRLLAWFKDDKVTVSDLQSLTSAIATHSAAEGVDPMMTLSIGASPADRERVRAMYVKAWGETGIGPTGESTRKWVEAARAEINRSETVVGEVDLLEAAARLAELNEAATRLWRGEVEAAGAIVELAGTAADRAKSAGSGSNNSGIGGTGGNAVPAPSEGDGRWLASYLSAGRSIPERLQRLKELESDPEPIGQADAELLVELACLESPSEVRAAAQRVITKYADSPVILSGFLKVLPRAPKYPTVSRTIEVVVHQSLPKATDPAWEFEARRALVERLLDVLASAGQTSATNRLAELLWQSCAARASDAAAGDTDADKAPMDSAAGAAASAALWQRWRDAAEAVSPNLNAPVSLDIIDRRREGRVALARGPIQQYAADQVGIAELMAYVVSAERPSRATDVARVLADMAARRRKAQHIFEQLMWTEAATLQLWLVRFEETL